MIPIIDDASHGKQNLTIKPHKLLTVLSHRIQRLHHIIPAIVIGLISMLGIAQAQTPSTPTHDTPRTLIADEPQTIELRADAMVQFIYHAEEAQWVQITTRAHPPEGDALAPDTVLLVRDSANTLLAYVDDTPIAGDDAPDESPTDAPTDAPTMATDARINALYLPAAGAYTILVDSFNGVSVGAVTVTLRVIDPFARTETSTADTTQLTLRLPRAVPFEYALTIPAGATLTLTARDISGTLDPLLFVYDAVDSRLLAQNDDHTSTDLTLNTLDAQLVYTAPPDEAQSLRLILRDFLRRQGVVELQWTITTP